MQNDQVVVGIAWYQREHWERLKQIADDSAAMDDSYDEWKKNANAGMHQIRLTDKTALRVNVDIDELLKWCAEHHKPMNSAARAEFVSEKLRARFDKT
ncbi:hypothetical protein [Rheinheimera soli]|jgi:hypothetical protein|uniref:Ribbon-helix-helix protein CopG domain-containing protein n=1 Tax=Rheinheimera soli TaxID=443616 RepID=A0ABU1VY81_9GAMM|nr:hypothetical protein [Rheinheimera soli]MDR7120681.1 hypothetical protein [Rheinheimera soli]